mgnify:FL=1
MPSLGSASPRSLAGGDRADLGSAAHVNLMRRADAAGQRLFRELVSSRIAWATVTEVDRLIAVDLVGVSLRATGCDHPPPCLLDGCLVGLQMRAMLGNRTPRLPGLRLATGSGVGGRVLASGAPLSIADYHHGGTDDDELIELTAELEGIAGLSCIPISFAGVVRGVLHVGLRHSGSLGDGPLEALAHVATYAGAALAAAGDRARVEAIVAARERRHLTRRLHDDFAQRLFSIGVSARVARERAATGHPDLIGQLLRLENEISAAGAALRTTMRGLDRPDPSAGALAVTLREDLSAFQDRTGIGAHLIVLGATGAEAAGAEVLLRAVREGMRNVERHARASEVVVTLCVDEHSVEVAVQDDGVGPQAPSSTGTGLGLRGLREEVARVDGELRLSRNEDVGATLRVRVPTR